MKGITDTEGRTQFSLWCILAAPLMLGTDVRNASAYTLATIGNAEAIQINQDALGIQGMVFSPSSTPYAPTPFGGGGFLANLSACPPPAFLGNWTLTAQGHLQQVGSNQCVVIFGCETEATSPVGTWECITNACGNELWSWQGPKSGGQITTQESGAGKQCLTGVPGSQGPQLSIAPCVPGAALQTWALDGTGVLSLPLAQGGAQCLWLPSPPPVNFYYKPLAPEGGVQPLALAVLNRGDVGVGGQTVSLGDFGFAPSQKVIVRDIWAESNSEPVAGSFTTRPIGSHETLLLRITPE